MNLTDHEPIALAVIGGTGLYRLATLAGARSVNASTPYGDASGPLRIGTLGGQTVAFLPRHGEGHALPPHKVNYRANLWLLREAGVRRVLAVNAVGGITQRFGPRVLGLPDQLIDYTWGRAASFWDGADGDLLHVDMTDPYTPSLRTAVHAAAREVKIPLVDGGCYGATQGPRLETRAEIERLRRDGCDVVGMTGMPEAGLARELGLDYACLALVANWAAGCGPAGTPAITMEEVTANLEHATARLPELIAAVLKRLAR
ncbi:MAG: S-methyl-5'-thioinosine phosphorylase [Proteobacteria bacterium]|nr:S-methyl-5'-thioinosine phosphorylase [Pseudomonadota bacterium]